MTKPTEKRQTLRARERKTKKKLFFKFISPLFRSLFCPIKISNESEIKFIFYLLFRWWFLPYIMWENSSIFLLSREWGRTWQKEWVSEKTCCLLLLSKILFVSWCQTIFIYSRHTLYYSAKIVETLNLLPFQIGIRDNREWWRVGFRMIEIMSYASGSLTGFEEMKRKSEDGEKIKLKARWIIWL